MFFCVAAVTEAWLVEELAEVLSDWNQLWSEGIASEILMVVLILK